MLRSCHILFFVELFGLVLKISTILEPASDNYKSSYFLQINLPLWSEKWILIGLLRNFPAHWSVGIIGLKLVTGRQVSSSDAGRRRRWKAVNQTRWGSPTLLWVLLGGWGWLMEISVKTKESVCFVTVKLHEISWWFLTFKSSHESLEHISLVREQRMWSRLWKKMDDSLRNKKFPFFLKKLGPLWNHFGTLV